MLLTAALLAASALSLTTAAPLTKIRSTLTADTIIAIAPLTASCVNAPADAPGECRTAAQAAGPIAKSFTKYGIDSAGEQAALIALMLFESGNFKYNKNHYPAPGRPGQGTRNMQLPGLNLQYAASLFGAATVQEAGDATAVLNLVGGDDESFGSAAWFLKTQCSQTIREGLASKADPLTGWQNYLTGCVGTTLDPQRTEIWTTTRQFI
ncbi:uncharacterized protein BDR25DRAFT_292003 [Lindgomyces ingoldianus]|uniref:Uncharacterized protein n=1 Tax=Lindgomyces ingoldianus TaxID=673940 RepID=A0ACB6QML4_9PLEO|nr:uncharacterized protein BDR25DRAFT_292003 [Lindgomyces ingoldianus]KAF2467547.1 hypothetical protein BDR25DRAFT_292003 [Lindgomyces ingoldianus]